MVEYHLLCVYGDVGKHPGARKKKKQFFHFTISEQANLILAPRAGFYKEN